MTDLPLLPVYLAGVWPPANWYIRQMIDIKRHPERPYPDDADETARDACLVALDDQLRVGADIVSATLGLPGVAEGSALLEHVLGLEQLPARRQLTTRLHNAQPLFQQVKPLLALRGLGVAANAERLLGLTSSPSVATLPGPYTLAGLIHGTHGRLVTATSLSALLRGEIESLAAIGVAIVQLDESDFAWADEDPAVLADLIRRTVEGIPVEVSLRLGYLDSHGRSSGRRRYKPWLVEMATALTSATINVRQFDLAFGAVEMAEIDVLADLPIRRIGLGVIDVSSPWVEPAALIAERLRQAAQYVTAERIMVALDGGMAALTRSVAIRKVSNMVEAARLVREEMGVREAAHAHASPMIQVEDQAPIAVMEEPKMGEANGEISS